ncbi:hypothetical protein [Paenibacillus oryzisoli]|uniref:Uncharacterized protein n=1 Tax=Paenibacillus oryzisoli TaxID=1850517 RepID=A0A198A304_9BACL|nr:hypothetical protein [Paenibacillus oryzisoli]OAS15406.1 hypothetical protein A8708_04440 [Paenibacillus oryzisoli]
MNIIVDIVRNALNHLYEEVFFTYISLNHDPNDFIKIMWSDNEGTYSAKEVFGDLHAADWSNILSIVNRVDLGMKLIPIKKAINDQIDSWLRYGISERERKFLERR